MTDYFFLTLESAEKIIQFSKENSYMKAFTSEYMASEIKELEELYQINLMNKEILA